MKSVGIGMIGCGVVGGGVWKHLQRNRELMSNRGDVQLNIRKIAVRDLRKKRDIPENLLTDDWKKVVEDPEVHVVLELIGGTTTAYEIAKAAIEAGKPLVTANKALLAEHGGEICKLADAKGVPIYFEASVAGGVPIIKALREGLRANNIRSIHGIINGTCNYILTRMANEGAEFKDVLAEAKILGYAEADESLDVDGIDAAHKAAILASLAYGQWLTIDDVYVEGIREICAMDIDLARRFGYAVKLLAIIRADEKKSVNVRVHPTLVPLQHVLASVGGVYNAIAVEGDIVGNTLFYGRGAGADATASAVLSDLFEAAANAADKRKMPPILGHRLLEKLSKIDEIRARYYIRFTVMDKPGVLAQIASIFGKNEVSISAVYQPERKQGEAVPLVMLIDPAQESIFQKAISEINGLSIVRDKTHIIRVEDFA